jgi:hypothetical protein
MSQVLWTLVFLLDREARTPRATRRATVLGLLLVVALVAVSDQWMRGDWMAQAGLSLEVRP